jgi:hypothetical protein
MGGGPPQPPLFFLPKFAADDELNRITVVKGFFVGGGPPQPPFFPRKMPLPTVFLTEKGQIAQLKHKKKP